MLGRVIGLGILSGTVATAYSFYENDFNIDSVGIVRFSRAASTGIHVMYHYKTTLYAPSVNKSLPNYQEIRSKSHEKAAELLLELCRTNKGVYIKIGQHIGALENLFPKEYTDTLKVLHSQAPITPLKEIYKIIKEDLKQDVCITILSLLNNVCAHTFYSTIYYIQYNIALFLYLYLH
uniref:Putative aarF domain-containing protein kinase 1 n=1 Tax=Melanaphis sacchari TaxID=742174 RepID=A0A2H8TVZ5_9HEMI